MSTSPFVVDIDQHNYAEIVIEGSRQVPVLVDFWASWCQPCKSLMPVLAKLADEYQGRFILAKINTEEQQAIAAQFGIRSIPTVKLFRDGVPIDEFMGALPEPQIRAFLDKHLPRESDNAVVQAEQLLFSGDPAGAIAMLEQARQSDPTNPRLTIAIAQIQMATGDPEGAAQALDSLPPDEQDKIEVKQLAGRLFFQRIAPADETIASLVARITEAPDDSASVYRLAARQVVDDDIAGALESLLGLMQRDRRFGDDAARLALLRLFDMLGDDPALNRYRARMFNLMH